MPHRSFTLTITTLLLSLSLSFSSAPAKLVQLASRVYKLYKSAGHHKNKSKKYQDPSSEFNA